MKRNAMVIMMMISLLMMVLLPAVPAIAEGGLLPSLTETVGIAMPSLGEALGRYPDEETENEDGSVIEFYTNVSESDFNIFSVYLQQQEAELADYKVEKGVLTAEIRAKGADFSLSYNSKSGEARVNYPSGTFDEWVKNAETHFEKAQSLLSKGDRDKAISEILCIPQYKDYEPVNRLLQNDKDFEEMLTIAAERQAKIQPFMTIGGIVTFGHYEQDNNMENGMEDIEWIVLDVREGESLLISKYIIDAKPYGRGEEQNWEDCPLREWLNMEFLDIAFTTNEKKAIMTTVIDNSESEQISSIGTQKKYGGGNDTRDQVFLLSYIETFEIYFSDREARCCAYTKYADKQASSGFFYDWEEYGEWWLRSNRTSEPYAAAIRINGGLEDYDKNADHVGVRPALWISLESDYFLPGNR